MQARTVLLLASSMVVASLAVFPAPTAAAPSGDRFLALYFDDPAITSTAPTATESKTGVLAGCPSEESGAPTGAPKVCKAREFGPMPDHGFGDTGIAMTSPVLVQVWLNATRELPLLDVDIAILFASTTGSSNIKFDGATNFFPMRNSTGEIPKITTEPQLFTFAYPPPSNAIPKETPFSVRVSIDIPGATNETVPHGCPHLYVCQPPPPAPPGPGVPYVGPDVAAAETEVFIHYASEQHPSGVFFVPNRPVPVDRSIGEGMFQMYLADDGFEGRRPNAPEVQKREIAAGTPNAPATTVWGSATAAVTYTFVSDAALYVPIAYEVVAAGAARAKTAAFLEFNATLTVDGQNFTGFAHIAPASDCRSAASVCEEILDIAVSLPTKNLTIAKGDTFSLSLSLSALAPPDTKYEVWYGGTEAEKDYHAGLFAALGEAVDLPAPPTTPTSPPTTTATSSATTATPSGSASASTSVPATSDDTNGTAGSAKARKEKDAGNPAQVVPNLTFVFVLAAVALGLAVVSRRRA